VLARALILQALRNNESLSDFEQKVPKNPKHKEAVGLTEDVVGTGKFAFGFCLGFGGCHMLLCKHMMTLFVAFM
jgi:hypothetical protein